MCEDSFVQHMVLNPHSNGEDIHGFEVRALEGLAGCEYLSDVPFVKDGEQPSRACSTDLY